jgi:membrane fusion protein (multidrug efflux system)
MFKKLLNRKHIKTTFIIGFFAASAFIWLCVIIYNHYNVSTDDAYVNAHVVHIAPRIAGQVARVAVSNNQYVHKGQLLFQLDPIPYLVALEKAKAQYAINQAAYQNALLKEKRTDVLAKKSFASSQDNDNAETALQTAAASVQLAKSALNEATLNLGWTNIVAPTSGWVTNMSTRAGDNVVASQPLFALISDESFWLDANFKETQIQNIRAGQRADIQLDMYPGVNFDGIVQSISGGTGTVFSLLPPQNATGNWVKITQRVPVKIQFTHPTNQYPLRIGASASVNVKLGT